MPIQLDTSWMATLTVDWWYVSTRKSEDPLDILFMVDDRSIYIFNI